MQPLELQRIVDFLLRTAFQISWFYFKTPRVVNLTVNNRLNVRREDSNHLILAVWFNEFASIFLSGFTENNTIHPFVDTRVEIVSPSLTVLFSVRIFVRLTYIFEYFPAFLRKSQHLWLEMCTQTWYVWSGSDTHDSIIGSNSNVARVLFLF